MELSKSKADNYVRSKSKDFTEEEILQGKIAPDTLTGETWLCKSDGGAVGRPDVDRTAEMLGACTYSFLERGTTLLRLAPLLTSDEEGEGSIWRCTTEACAPSFFPSCTHCNRARSSHCKPTHREHSIDIAFGGCHTLCREISPFKLHFSHSPMYLRRA